MTDKFIELLINKINNYYTCYYEEAPSNASFPYLVIPTLSINPLLDIGAGFNCNFDIEIYINELSTDSVENIIDTLRDCLDGYYYRDNDLSFHIGFDNQLIIKSNEQDLIIRRASFIARIFR